ncbi:WD40 repeat domain-containing protein [Streptomyces sp. WAC 05379]|uniref:WD40 repeat domain-containing protein n=1 Tax=Streptomyces sp. WAC 05379 TaxID=2203207 RepID=UPI00163BB403|nr:WD40 repeat domain-containing protein [Streptomyces sp. WAC 05379]
MIADEGDTVSQLCPAIRAELPVLALAFFQDHFLIVVTCQAVRLWDVAGRRWFGDIPVTASPPWDRAVFSPSCRRLAIGSEKGEVHVWDVTDAQPLGVLPAADGGPIRSMAFSSDDRFLATTGSRGTVQLWDVTSGEPSYLPLPDKGDVCAVALSPDGSHLAAGRSDGTVLLWNLVSGSYAGDIAADDQPLSSILLSCDGRHLAIRNRTGRIRILWDAVPIPPHAAQPGAAPFLAFSPDGRHLVSGMPDGSLGAWDVAAHSALLTSGGHQLTHHDLNGPLAFSSDSSVLAVSHNHAVVLYAWHPQLRHLLSPEEHSGRQGPAPTSRPWATPRLS